mmetsp:Transcript_32027/g.107831  ORF Transcript_32027/g.107831 Transcript_32027/m.107831 type:complete len:239 (+) Transcript_32027:947-1663(+)
MRFVVPMTRMFVCSSRPSSFVKNVFTTPSRACDPAAPSAPLPPRLRRTESISSKTMTCNDDFPLLLFHSWSASVKRLRTFCSEEPSRWPKTSGPLTNFGGRSLSSLARPRASSDLPVPGGPWSSSPRACWRPSLWRASSGMRRLRRTRRSTVSTSPAQPPTPSAACRSTCAAASAARCRSARGTSCAARLDKQRGPWCGRVLRLAAAASRGTRSITRRPPRERRRARSEVLDRGSQGL